MSFVTRSFFTTFSLGLGMSVGASFALTMDEVIYLQMRKNVIIPIQMVKFKRDSRVSDLTLDDIKEIGEGTGKFMS
jgi:hypothetical protein